MSNAELAAGGYVGTGVETVAQTVASTRYVDTVGELENQTLHLQ